MVLSLRRLLWVLLLLRVLLPLGILRILILRVGRLRLARIRLLPSLVGIRLLRRIGSRIGALVILLSQNHARGKSDE